MSCSTHLSMSSANLTQANLDYMDDNAERLGRQKMRSDAMKRQFAINGAPHDQRIFLLRLNHVLP